METLDIVIEAPAWCEDALDALANRAVTATLHHCGLAPEDCEITLLACDDARISTLNAAATRTGL